MNTYGFFRPFLFALPPEVAHEYTLRVLSAVSRVKRAPDYQSREKCVQLLGLTFPNRLGLAAGFDKSGKYIDALGKLGFGFIEVGTMTPLPQPGNDKPRIFRLPANRAIINRMGFPNDGMNSVVARLRRSCFGGVKGINIGKNASTPLDSAVEDYALCFIKAYSVADYFVVNVSSPNTPRLRELQQPDHLRNILLRLDRERTRLRESTGRDVPVLVKISPDLSDYAVCSCAELCLSSRASGIVATNSSISRDHLISEAHDRESGGISGSPRTSTSRHIVSRIRSVVGPDMLIVGVGGIMSPEDAAAMIEVGADLIQIYTGLVYAGPSLVRDIVNVLQKWD